MAKKDWTFCINCVKGVERNTCSRGDLYDKSAGCFSGMPMSLGIKPKARKKEPEKGFTPHGDIAIYQASQAGQTQVSFVLPFLPPSKNKWRGVKGVGISTRYFKPWYEWFDEQVMAWEARNGRIHRHVGEVIVRVHFCYANFQVHDMLNLASFPPLMDGLVRQAFLIDDSDKYVKLFEITSSVEGKDKTIITLAYAK